MKINFSGVEIKENNGGGNNLYVKPGIQKLTVVKLDTGTYSTGTGYAEVTFQSDQAEKPFTEKFALTPKALQRLKYLSEKLTGEEFNTEIDTDVIAAKIVGKTAEFMVNGREYISSPKEQSDGTMKTFVNIGVELPFMGFIGPFPEGSKPFIKPLPTEEKATTTANAGVGVAPSDDDLPF